MTSDDETTSPASSAGSFLEKKELLEAYDAHPLQIGTILERVMRGGRHPITELDLANDEETQITDQNHIGGGAFVKALAKLAHVQESEHVVDLGAGLGGPARLLAYLYGCSVLAIDISETRCRAARELTQLTGLTSKVTTACADVTTMSVRDIVADVLWGQNALLHIRDRKSLFSRWAPVLRHKGRIALEDVYVSPRPRSQAQEAMLEQLSACWLAHLTPIGNWGEDLAAAGFVVTALTDLSSTLAPWLTGLRRAVAGANPPPAREADGWLLGEKLANDGVIGYFRLLATRNA